MNIVKCENAHFYDSERFDSCPHCQNVVKRNDNETIGLTFPEIKEQVTSILPDPIPLIEKKTDIITDPLLPNFNADGEKTISFFSHSIGVDPVVGWLLCIEGSHFGEDFTLKSGRNFIGRALSMDVNISNDNTVSRDKHAIIIYEPKRHTYLVQAGESKELCYLNDQVVLTAEQIKVNDVITVGSTKLMFFPCCNDVFNWDMVKKEQADD